MEHACSYYVESIPNYLAILIILKQSNVKRQDGLHQTTAELAVYLIYWNLLNGR